MSGLGIGWLALKVADLFTFSSIIFNSFFLGGGGGKNSLNFKTFFMNSLIHFLAHINEEYCGNDLFQLSNRCRGVEQ
jgi:hypothetical protein